MCFMYKTYLERMICALFFRNTSVLVPRSTYTLVPRNDCVLVPRQTLRGNFFLHREGVSVPPTSHYESLISNFRQKPNLLPLPVFFLVCKICDWNPENRRKMSKTSYFSIPVYFHSQRLQSRRHQQVSSSLCRILYLVGETLKI